MKAAKKLRRINKHIAALDAITAEAEKQIDRCLDALHNAKNIRANLANRRRTLLANLDTDRAAISALLKKITASDPREIS